MKKSKIFESSSDVFYGSGSMADDKQWSINKHGDQYILDIDGEKYQLSGLDDDGIDSLIDFIDSSNFANSSEMSTELKQYIA